MRLKEQLKEQTRRGERGYPFELYDSNLVVRNHWHNEIEFIVILFGTLHIFINDIEYCGVAGDVFIINKNELHGMYGQDVQYHAFVFDLNMLMFSMEDFYQRKFLKALLSGIIRFYNKPENSEIMQEIFHRVVLYITEKKQGYTLAVKAALLEVICLMLAEGQYIMLKNRPQFEAKDQLLKSMVLYMEEHLEEQIRLKDIAGEFHMSPKYFCRFFKKNFNMTFIDYINNMRIERATLMLWNGEKTITDIAMSCGFSNGSYFTRIFKRMIGCTPSEYKHRMEHNWQI